MVQGGGQPLTIACFLLWGVHGRCCVGSRLRCVCWRGHGRWGHIATGRRVAAVLLLSIMLLHSTTQNLGQEAAWCM